MLAYMALMAAAQAVQTSGSTLIKEGQEAFDVLNKDLPAPSGANLREFQSLANLTIDAGGAGANPSQSVCLDTSDSRTLGKSVQEILRRVGRELGESQKIQTNLLSVLLAFVRAVSNSELWKLLGVFLDEQSSLMFAMLGGAGGIGSDSPSDAFGR